MSTDRVVNISTLKPEWDDIVVISVDYGNLPAKARQEYSKSVLEAMKPMFPNNKLIIISNKTDISLEKEV